MKEKYFNLDPDKAEWWVKMQMKNGTNLPVNYFFEMATHINLQEKAKSETDKSAGNRPDNSNSLREIIEKIPNIGSLRNYYNALLRSKLSNGELTNIPFAENFAACPARAKMLPDESLEIPMLPKERRTDGAGKVLRIRSTTIINETRRNTLYRWKKWEEDPDKNRVSDRTQEVLDKQASEIKEKIDFFKKFIPPTDIHENIPYWWPGIRQQGELGMNPQLSGLTDIALIQDQIKSGNNSDLWDITFFNHLRLNPVLRKNIEEFIKTCKKYFTHTERLPNFKRGSVIFTPEGEIFMLNLFDKDAEFIGEKKGLMRQNGEIVSTPGIQEQAIDDWYAGNKSPEKLYEVGLVDENYDPSFDIAVRQLHFLEYKLWVADQRLEQEDYYRFTDPHIYQSYYKMKPCPDQGYKSSGLTKRGTFCMDYIKNRDNSVIYL